MQIGRFLVTRADQDRIHGWREIAAYLGRDERTAKRWEKQRGLPVRRIPGEGRANVYAQRSEVEAWLLDDRGRAAEVPVETAAGGVAAATRVAAEPAEAAGEGAGTGPEASEPWVGDGEAPAPGEIAAADGGEPGDSGSSGDSGEWGEAGAVGRARIAKEAFRPAEHLSLMVSVFGLLLLLTATAVRFFHVGPLEAILFASESVPGAEPVGRGSDAVRDELYLRGVYLCEMRSPASLAEAQRLFLQAIARDPRHAPSYSGLAKTYLLLREYATMPNDEAYSRAKEAAERAVRLDPKQTEAHAALGFVNFFSLRKAEEAEREFGLAMEADDRSALAHHWFGSMLMHQGRYAEAVAQLNAAQQLAPTSTAILASKALALGFGGHKDEAMRLLEAMDGTGQDAAMVHRDLGYLSLVAPRDTGRFLRESVRFAELRRDGETVALLRVAAEAFAARGETAMWETMLREERAAHPDAAHPTYLMAEADAALGHEQAALGELARLAEDRDGRMVGMVMEPAFLGLHKDAGFTKIAEELGLVYPVIAAR